MAPCYTAVAACERLTEAFLRLAVAAAVIMANQACYTNRFDVVTTSLSSRIHYANAVLRKLPSEMSRPN